MKNIHSFILILNIVLSKSNNTSLYNKTISTNEESNFTHYEVNSSNLLPNLIQTFEDNAVFFIDRLCSTLTKSGLDLMKIPDENDVINVYPRNKVVHVGIKMYRIWLHGLAALELCGRINYSNEEDKLLIDMPICINNVTTHLDYKLKFVQNGKNQVLQGATDSVAGKVVTTLLVKVDSEAGRICFQSLHINNEIVVDIRLYGKKILVDSNWLSVSIFIHVTNFIQRLIKEKIINDLAVATRKAVNMSIFE